MPRATKDFTRAAAHDMIGRHVKLTHDLVGRFVGETGTVTDCMDVGFGYELRIVWDIGFASGEERYDYFDAGEFNELPREC